MNFRASHRRIRYGLFLLAPLALGFSGCASGPSGGSDVPNVANRFTVRLTTRDTVNSNYYYAVAFDDNPGSDAGSVNDGPVAIVGETPILNRVVGGNWRVMVLWHLGQFRVFRRATPTDPTSDQEIPATALISRRVSGNIIEFTFDLDATFGSNQFVFPRQPVNGNAAVTAAPARFDLNFVTTDRVDVVGSDIKAVDSNGAGLTALPLTNVQLAGTVTRDFGDVANDINDFAVRPDDFGRMDVTALRIQVNRTDGAS